MQVTPDFRSNHEFILDPADVGNFHRHHVAGFQELRWIESDADATSFRWTQGAQFAVDREQIRRRPLSYYQTLFQLSQQAWVTVAGKQLDNHSIAWLFELFWRNVFLAEAV